MQDHTPEFTQLQFHFEQSPIEQRFWAKVDKTSSPSGCWLWTACKSRGTYGLFFHEGKGQVAHRVAWQLIVGPIPKGIQLCHNCPGGDNPSCVNPAHLFLGTQQDNILDCVKKGRWHPHKLLGTSNPNSKLTPPDVIAIRELASQGISFREIGRRFGVGHNTVGGIVRREWYAWIP